MYKGSINLKDLKYLKDIKDTKVSWPTQWSAKTISGSDVYIRYSHGSLVLSIDGIMIRRVQYNGHIRGVMGTPVMKNLLDIIELNK